MAWLFSVGIKKSPEKAGDVVGFNFNSTIETILIIF